MISFDEDRDFFFLILIDSLIWKISSFRYVSNKSDVFRHSYFHNSFQSFIIGYVSWGHNQGRDQFDNQILSK